MGIMVRGVVERKVILTRLGKRQSMCSRTWYGRRKSFLELVMYEGNTQSIW